jgi:hypothetical protein
MNVKTNFRYASVLVGFALVCVPGIVDAANFSGTWSVAGAMGHPFVETVAPVCVFQQAGSRIAGTCKGPAGIGSAVGAVSGSTIIWRWSRVATSRAQHNGFVTFRGVWGRAGLSGTWVDSAVPGLVGTFAARKL